MYSHRTVTVCTEQQLQTCFFSFFLCPIYISTRVSTNHCRFNAPSSQLPLRPTTTLLLSSVSPQYLQQLPAETRVIRVMPNIAAVVQSSACVYARGKHAGNRTVSRSIVWRHCLGECGNDYFLVGTYLTKMNEFPIPRIRHTSLNA